MNTSQEAYFAGYQAAVEGKDILSNPYSFDDPLHREWVRGWMSGRQNLGR